MPFLVVGVLAMLYFATKTSSGTAAPPAVKVNSALDNAVAGATKGVAPSDQPNPDAPLQANPHIINNPNP